MGLDLVELRLSIEEEFGVHIDDDAASRMETPGDIADYLCHRLRMDATAPCPSQQGFYRLRSALVETFGVNSNSIRTDTALQPILAGNIKRNWKRMQQALTANDFPRLQRSRLLYIMTVLALPAIPALSLLMQGLPLSLAVILFGTLYIIANFATYKLGSVLPADYSTVASLIPYVCCSSSSVWSRDEVLDRVITLTSIQLGIPKAQIHADSHFIRDLGAD